MSVRLAMLARDEEDRLEAAACKLRGLYDDWILLVDDRDAGLSEIAARQHLEGPGRSVPFRFENFGQARNELFAAAREGLGEEDFILLADPDSPPSGVLPGLIHDWYHCRWRMGKVEWLLPILVRATLECRYEGAAHELLVVPNGEAWGVAEELFVDVDAKPFSVERAETYLELLLPSASTSPRDAFYLARTYAELGRAGESIEAYLRCAAMPQPAEQAYLAILNAGVLLRGLDVELGRVLLERARQMRPSRGETFYHLAWLANQLRDPERAAALCAEAIQLPPCPDGLFVNRWAEREGILLELGRAVDALRERDGLTTLEE